MDQGIIKAFKAGYRRRLVQRLLINLCMGTDYKTDLLGAIQIIAGLEEAGDECLKDMDDAEECVEVAFRDLSHFPGVVPSELTVEDFINAESEVQAVADLTDDDIVAGIAGAQEGDSSDDKDNCALERCARVQPLNWHQC
ncbi:hypothetical protein V5799_005571 [Amblyomma americanum]|uniref:Uncharacterized protein n=1 Tax=Amblyomma americanum TaxID=6943 RepID=A0AAQ4DYV8_AMBAM